MDKIQQIIKLRTEGFKEAKPSLKDPKDNPCWKGYHPVGLKPNGDPNCVPVQASEEFVIPKPHPGEQVPKFISRCIAKIAKEYDKPGQAAAVCYGQLK